MRALLVLAGLLLAAAYTKSIYLPIHTDEQVFIAYAGALSHGLELYSQLSDHKPPGIYGISMLVYHTKPYSLYMGRVLAILSQLVIAMTIYMLVNKQHNNKYIGYITSISYLTMALMYQGSFFLTETFAMVFVLLGMYLFVTKQENVSWKTTLLIGMCLGISGLYNQKAVLFAPVLLYYIWHYTKNSTLMVVAALGVSMPIISTILVFYQTGTIEGMMYWTLYYPLFEYHAYSINDTIRALPEVLVYGSIMWIVWLLSLVSIVKKQIRKSNLLLYVICSVLPFMFIIFRPYHHYLLLAIPFVVLTAANAFSNVRVQQIVVVWVMISAVGWLIFAV